MSQAFARCGCVDGAEAIVPDELGVELLASSTDPSVAAVEYLSLAEAKLHCKVDLTDDDTLIQAYIAAARDMIEGDTEAAWVPQGFIARYAITNLQSPIPLNPYPITEVTAVDLVPHDVAARGAGLPLPPRGVATTNGITGWHLHEDTGLLYPPADGWPALPDSVRVTYTAGPEAEAVPPGIQQATRLLVGAWYDHRAALADIPTIPLPLAYQTLIARYRRSIGMSFS